MWPTSGTRGFIFFLRPLITLCCPQSKDEINITTNQETITDYRRQLQDFVRKTSQHQVVDASRSSPDAAAEWLVGDVSDISDSRWLLSAESTESKIPNTEKSKSSGFTRKSSGY